MTSIIDQFAIQRSDASMRALIDDALRGNLANDELAHLASVMGTSGSFEPLDSSAVTADLASTGGPTSLSTLLGPLYLRAMGCIVPKLGVPGRPAGGVDSLAQIEGYSVNLKPMEVRRTIERCGYAHFLADANHAPLDKQLFAFRQQVGAQNIPELAIASILAKKIAVGLQRAGLDIRVAKHGNFGPSWNEAKKNALRFRLVAATVGIDASCILTDASTPYQSYVGRGESLLALRKLFLGNADCQLYDHAIQCFAMACSVAKFESSDLKSVMSVAADHFYANLDAQGASRDNFEEYTASVEQQQTIELVSSREGFVDVCLATLRDVIVHYQGAGDEAGKMFPDGIGIVLKRLPGDLVRAGDLLATVRTKTMHWESVEKSLNRAIRVVDSVRYARGFEEVRNG